MSAQTISEHKFPYTYIGDFQHKYLILTATFVFELLCCRVERYAASGACQEMRHMINEPSFSSN
jgi:hypothetical protein